MQFTLLVIIVITSIAISVSILVSYIATIMSPHIGSATFLTRTKMAEVAAKNLLNVLNQEKPIYLANPEVIDGVKTHCE